VGVDPAVAWEVLADPRLYPLWVVGGSTVRGIEGRFPETGSAFLPTQLLIVQGRTHVTDVDPPHRIELLARLPVVGDTAIVITVGPEPGGTRFEIEEWAVGGLLGLLPRPASDGLIWLRNVLGVRRFARLAEVEAALPGT
jgi:uncharacterized protein YndB with AHSA1/START domain